MYLCAGTPSIDKKMGHIIRHCFLLRASEKNSTKPTSYGQIGRLSAEQFCGSSLDLPHRHFYDTIRFHQIIAQCHQSIQSTDCQRWNFELEHFWECYTYEKHDIHLLVKLPLIK